MEPKDAQTTMNEAPTGPIERFEIKLVCANCGEELNGYWYFVRELIYKVYPCNCE